MRQPLHIFCLALFFHAQMTYALDPVPLSDPMLKTLHSSAVNNEPALDMALELPEGISIVLAPFGVMDTAWWSEKIAKQRKTTGPFSNFDFSVRKATALLDIGPIKIYGVVTFPFIGLSKHTYSFPTAYTLVADNDLEMFEQEEQNSSLNSSRKRLGGSWKTSNQVLGRLDKKQKNAQNLIIHANYLTRYTIPLPGLGIRAESLSTLFGFSQRKLFFVELGVRLYACNFKAIVLDLRDSCWIKYDRSEYFVGYNNISSSNNCIGLIVYLMLGRGRMTALVTFEPMMFQKITLKDLRGLLSIQIGCTLA